MHRNPLTRAFRRALERPLHRDCETLRRSVIVMSLTEWSGYRFAPKLDRDVIPWNLMHLPLTEESSKHLSSGCGSDAPTPVLWHDEELSQDMRWPCTHQRDPGEKGLDRDQERMARRLRPVVVEIPVPEPAMSVEVRTIEPGELLGVEFQELADESFVLELRRLHLNTSCGLARSHVISMGRTGRATVGR